MPSLRAPSDSAGSAQAALRTQEEELQDGAELTGNLENKELPHRQEKSVSASAGTCCVLSPPRQQMSLQPGSSQHPLAQLAAWPAQRQPGTGPCSCGSERAQEPSAGTGSPSTALQTSAPPNSLSLGAAVPPARTARPHRPHSPARTLTFIPAPGRPPQPAAVPGKSRPDSASRGFPDRAPPGGDSGRGGQGTPEGTASPGCCTPATSPIRRLAGTGSGQRAPGSWLLSEGERDPSPHPQSQVLLQRGRTICLTHG